MKTGILIVSFGTTFPDTRKKNIGKMTECVRAAYPEALVKEAVSSRIVRMIMCKKEGIAAYDVEEALGQMYADGVTHVTVLPTHIIDGIENSAMLGTVEEFRKQFADIKVADVLLKKAEDYENTARALWESVKDIAGEDPVIFMGHGTAHEADASYQRMEQALREYSGHEVYMATVEGSVTIEDVIVRMKHCVSGGRVVVTPFMLVAGDHANNDMAGEEDSFASRLREEGYEPECILKGIGEYAAIREIYLGHLRQAFYRGSGVGESSGKGILYGIGVGPGDPELLTLKAVRRIRESDVLMLPAVSKEECYAYQIAVRAVPEAALKESLCMAFPMIRDAGKLELAHRRIYEAITDHLDQGKNVGFLTLGDPAIYSTYMYMHHRAIAEGRDARIISGIPSFCAAAARLGISLGEKQEEIHVIPASYAIEDTLDYKGTRIYMKSGKKLQELVKALEEYSEKEKRLGEYQGLAQKEALKSGMEVYAITNCGMETEQVYYGLEEVKHASGYLTLVIVK